MTDEEMTDKETMGEREDRKDGGTSGRYQSSNINGWFSLPKDCII